MKTVSYLDKVTIPFLAKMVKCFLLIPKHFYFFTNFIFLLLCICPICRVYVRISDNTITKTHAGDLSYMQLTIATISQLAGVSKTTVSRVINNNPNVNRETRKRVLDIIESKGYFPNARAQAFSSKRTRTIGLVLPYDEAYTISNPYFSELLRSILEQVRKRNYHIIISYFLDEDCFKLVRQKMVDGLLLLTPSADHKSIVKALIEMKVPVVSTSRIIGIDDLHYIAVDEYTATCKVLDYLISAGHQKIGLILGPKSLYSNASRLKAYRKSMKEHNLPFDENLITCGDTSMESGMEMMRMLLKNNKEISAVFACSDMMAIGARQVIYNAGLKIPSDVYLISSDATLLSKYLDAPLTTLTQPTYERGRLAVDHLIKIIEGEDPGKPVMLPLDYIVSDSLL